MANQENKRKRLTVDAQRAVLEAQRQAAELRGQRASSTILLAKALGGWEQPQPSQQVASK